jgi:hypothetical protein
MRSGRGAGCLAHAVASAVEPHFDERQIVFGRMSGDLSHQIMITLQ